MIEAFKVQHVLYLFYLLLLMIKIVKKNFKTVLPISLLVLRCVQSRTRALHKKAGTAKKQDGGYFLLSSLHQKQWPTRWALFFIFEKKQEFEVIVYCFICLFTVSLLGRPALASSTISCTPRVQSGKPMKFVFKLLFIFISFACQIRIYLMQF